MLNLKDFMTAVGYRITEGSEFCWDCYGNKAYSLDSWNGDVDGYSATVIFDTATQVVYEMQVNDYRNNRAYRLMNPEFKTAYIEEARRQNCPHDEAWDDVSYTDLDVDADFLEKLTAIMNGQPYDERVQVEFDLPEEDQLTLMRMAHEADLTLNEFVALILSRELDRLKEGK